jgi:protein-S-isoprenylcysteine O-methyltransferase Ste14
MKCLELRVPPLALTVAVAAAMLATAHGLPMLRVAWPGSAAAAIVCAVVGAALASLAVVEFRCARTTVNPLMPDSASRVVKRGVFRISRNPMYLGMSLLLLALALYQSHALSFAWVAGYVAYVSRFQIQPEERALEALFGNEYRAYARTVRRWI